MVQDSPQFDLYAKHAKAAAIFTPGAPVNKLTLFRGRLREIKAVLEAINQYGRHPIIYGERGVGKTSLATVLDELLSKAGIVGLKFAHVNAAAEDTFSSLWLRVFNELHITEDKKLVTDAPQTSLHLNVTMASLLPDAVMPDDIRILASIVGGHLIVIIDEFDQLRGKVDDLRMMANTIKTVSDRRAPLTIVLVGVADTVDALIQEHESISRNLAQIQMPRMSGDEVSQIIREGLAELSFTIEADAVSYVCSLAQGLPAVVHHIGLQLAYSLIETSRTHASVVDVRASLTEVTDRMGQSLLSSWTKATKSPRQDALFDRVLLSCALCERDELGWFRPADILEAFRTTTGNRTYGIGAYSQHLHLLAEEEKGRVLERRGEPRRYEFRFRHPLFQSYVLMRGVASGLLTEQILERFKVNLPAQPKQTVQIRTSSLPTEP